MAKSNPNAGESRELDPNTWFGARIINPEAAKKAWECGFPEGEEAAKADGSAGRKRGR